MNIARAILPSSRLLYKASKLPTPVTTNIMQHEGHVQLQTIKCKPTSIAFPETIESSDTPLVRDTQTLDALRVAIHHLLSLDDVVALPTETVYGLGANALSPIGVGRIFSAKGRPQDNPLIVHVSSLPMLRRILPQGYTPSVAYKALMDAFWPGPLTLLFPANNEVIPPGVTAGHSSVAVRMPAHPVARALIALAETPLAAPSANSSGKPSPTRAEHVIEDLGVLGRLGVLLDGGPCSVGVESTVVDGLGEDGDIRILRPGGVTVEDIQRVVDGLDSTEADRPKVLVHRRDYEDKAIESAPTTPGMKYRHYSPTVPVIMLMTNLPAKDRPRSVSFQEVLSQLPAQFDPRPSNSLRVGLLAPSDSPLLLHRPPSNISLEHFALGTRSDPATSAQRLFDGLLTLDKSGVQVILAEGIPEEREGLAFMNRAKKAASSVLYVGEA